MSGMLLQVARFLLSNHVSTVWPLVVVPALVFGLSRPILKTIRRMTPGNLWAERLALWTSMMPGLAFIGLGVFTLQGFNFGMARHASGTCFVHCYGLAFIFLTIPLRAAIVFYQRHRRISRLLALSESPSPRLAALQAELNIPMRELPASEPACFLAGLFHFVVCVSRGALSTLSDDELRAAMLHERAHWRRRETLRASLAMFLNECSVFPVRAALDEYRRCAEFIADRETLKDAHAVNLASALLAFARFSIESPLAVNLAGQNVADRVSFLLGVEPQTDQRFLDKARAVALLAAAGSVALFPFWIAAVARLFCAGRG